MKEFLLKIVNGIQTKDVQKSECSLVDELLKLKVIKERRGIYKLDSKYRIGTLDVSRNGTGYLQVLSTIKTKDLLIESHDLNGGGRKDIVVVKRIYSKSGRPKAKVIFIIKKEFEVSVVYTKKVGNNIVGLNIKTELQTEIAASQKSLKKLPVNTVLKVDNYTSAIVEVLGVLDDPKVDEKISLALYDKKEEFPSECEVEAKSHGDSVDKSMYPNRVDLTHLPFCTIDPPDAKDFDDAIYFDVKENALYVAIADVSEYVFDMGCIDKSARERGFSIYFPHKSIPMLPRALSENICSLKPNEDRLAFTYKITLDKKSLEPIREELMDAVIHSKRRYTYDKIDEFLESHFENRDSVDDEILKFLLPLNEFMGKVRKKRLESSFEFSSMEVRMEVDEKQNLIATNYEKETASHALIEDCMLLANKAAAKSFQKGVFRVHESPSIEKIEDLLDDLAIIGILAEFSNDTYTLIKNLQEKAREKDLKEYVDKLIIRAQKQAVYSPDNIGHFGLGFKTYTHFTSPIRRYSDLIVHKLLKAIIRGNEKQKKYVLKNIEPITVRVSELERESDKVAWDYMDRKYARWAKDNIGKIVSAVITDTNRNPIAMLKDEIVGARIFLLDSDVELFEKVKVEIIQSSITTTKIIGQIVSREELDV